MKNNKKNNILKILLLVEQLFQDASHNFQGRFHFEIIS